MEPVRHQQCVWSLIKECVPDSELPEIRTILGDQLIDMYKETYSELQMWEQIWCKAQDKKAKDPRCSLSDPPAVKELLRAELQLLLLTVQNKAASLGRDGDKILSQYSPRVVNYALCNSGTEGQRRPSSSFENKTSISRPESSRSRSSSRLSSCSNLEDEIEALRNKLNITHIDEVVSHLKSVLTKECEDLKKEIQFLQGGMELEYQKHRKAEFMEPTLTELKEERRLIQRDILVQNLMTDAMCTDKPKDCISQIPSREKRLTTNHSERMMSSVSPKTGLPHPPVSRPAISCKHRHSHLQSSAKSTASNLTPTVCQEPHLYNFQNQCTTRLSQGSTASVTVQQKCKEENVFAQLAASKINSERAVVLQAPLMPAPPTGQKADSKGQRVGRRLVFHQSGNLLSAT